MFPRVGKHTVLVPEETGDLEVRGLRAEPGKKCCCIGVCLHTFSFVKIKNK